MNRKKCYLLTHINHYQPNDSMKIKLSLIEEMSQSAENLYNLLAQDYQTRNNLRALKVLKEKDLEIIGRCTSDCLFQKNTIKALNLLMQDQA